MKGTVSLSGYKEKIKLSLISKNKQKNTLKQIITIKCTHAKLRLSPGSFASIAEGSLNVQGESEEMAREILLRRQLMMNVNNKKKSTGWIKEQKAFRGSTVSRGLGARNTWRI